jgi:hypothetical protein
MRRSNWLLAGAFAVAAAAALFAWLQTGSLPAPRESSRDAVLFPASAGPEAVGPPASTSGLDVPPNTRSYAAARLQQIKAEPEQWKDPARWHREFAAADSPELEREVVGLARQIGAESFLAILAQALASRDALVRLEAARSIALLPEDRFREGVVIGLGAEDAEIRGEVMDMVAQAQPHLRPGALRDALAAAFPDVQERAVGLLTEQPSPELFAVLLEGLRLGNDNLRGIVNEAINEIVEHRFESYEEAARWWLANRNRFDGMMLRAE